MDGSDEFAVQMFDSLARKRGIVKQVLTKDELKDFYEQLTDQGFDNRLRTFFDMLVLSENTSLVLSCFLSVLL
jgi:respiratory burst oxidase